MAIGGKQFKFCKTDYKPCLRIDVIICSPEDNQAAYSFKIKKALVDTGSDVTLMPENVVLQLGLKFLEKRDICGYGDESDEVDFYVGKIIVKDILEEIFEIGAVKSSPILGMDFINYWHILINSPNEVFEIANKDNYIPPPSTP